MHRRSFHAAALTAMFGPAAAATAAFPAPAGWVGAAWRGGQAPRRVLRGHAGHPDRAPAVAADTLWRVASISKLAQAVVVLRLAEAGRLDLLAPLDDWLGFRLRHPDGHAVNARDLLSHRSGLRDVDRGGLYITPEPLGARQLAPHWAARHFSYANLNSIVLGTALEALLGQRYDELMQQWLFAPLGMEAAFDPGRLSDAQRARTATLQRPGPQGWKAQTADLRAGPVPARAGADYRPGRNCQVLAPQGGLITNLQSLERLAEALRSCDPRLLSPTGHRQLRESIWRAQPGGQDDTHGGLFQAWSHGAQCFTDTAGADRLRSRGGLRGFGHLAEAYGLLGGLVVQPAQAEDPGWAMIYLLHGSAETPGRHSAFAAVEEAVMTELLDPIDLP